MYFSRTSNARTEVKFSPLQLRLLLVVARLVFGRGGNSCRIGLLEESVDSCRCRNLWCVEQSDDVLDAGLPQMSVMVISRSCLALRTVQRSM